MNTKKTTFIAAGVAFVVSVGLIIGLNVQWCNNTQSEDKNFEPTSNVGSDIVNNDVDTKNNDSLNLMKLNYIDLSNTSNGYKTFSGDIVINVPKTMHLYGYARRIHKSSYSLPYLVQKYINNGKVVEGIPEDRYIHKVSVYFRQSSTRPAFIKVMEYTDWGIENVRRSYRDPCCTNDTYTPKSGDFVNRYYYNTGNNVWVESNKVNPLRDCDLLYLIDYKLNGITSIDVLKRPIEDDVEMKYGNGVKVYKNEIAGGKFVSYTHRVPLVVNPNTYLFTSNGAVLSDLPTFLTITSVTVYFSTKRDPLLIDISVVDQFSKCYYSHDGNGRWRKYSAENMITIEDLENLDSKTLYRSD